MKPSFTHAQLVDLEKNLEDWHKAFFSVPEYRDYWVPKWHYALHLAHDIWRFGPPRLNWCMGYEARNQHLKHGATRSNFRNTLKATVEFWCVNKYSPHTPWIYTMPCVLTTARHRTDGDPMLDFDPTSDLTTGRGRINIVLDSPVNPTSDPSLDRAWIDVILKCQSNARLFTVWMRGVHRCEASDYLIRKSVKYKQCEAIEEGVKVAKSGTIDCFPEHSIVLRAITNLLELDADAIFNFLHSAKINNQLLMTSGYADVVIEGKKTFCNVKALIMVKDALYASVIKYPDTTLEYDVHGVLHIQARSLQPSRGRLFLLSIASHTFAPMWHFKQSDGSVTFISQW